MVEESKCCHQFSGEIITEVVNSFFLSSFIIQMYDKTQIESTKMVNLIPAGMSTNNYEYSPLHKGIKTDRKQ